MKLETDEAIVGSLLIFQGYDVIKNVKELMRKAFQKLFLEFC